MITLTASAFLPLLMGSSYDLGIHRVTAYLGLYLVALGNGGIKPCVPALGADQFDATDPVERVTKGSLFNWYYWSVNIGSCYQPRFSSGYRSTLDGESGWKEGLQVSESGRESSDKSLPGGGSSCEELQFGVA